MSTTHPSTFPPPAVLSPLVPWILVHRRSPGTLWRQSLPCQRGGEMWKCGGGTEVWENEWRDIFTCVVTGPRFSAGCVRLRELLRVSVNSNVTQRRHRGAAGNTVLCCCIINKSSALDHLSCGLWGVRRDAVTTKVSALALNLNLWSFFLDSNVWPHSQQSGRRCRRKNDEDANKRMIIRKSI